MSGCIFLDRDGTINQGAPPGQYVLDILDFRFLPGALDALAFLAKNSEKRIAICTNQSPIGRGLATQRQVDSLHAYMVEHVEALGGRIDGVYVCPHAPEENCWCRKPRPGLLLRAAQELGVGLAQSVLVGDTTSDLQAGWRAGVGECYLIANGVQHFPDSWRGGRYRVVESLLEAAREIVDNERG